MAVLFEAASELASNEYALNGARVAGEIAVARLRAGYADGLGFQSIGNPESVTPFTGFDGGNSFNPQLLVGTQTCIAHRRRKRSSEAVQT